MQNERTNTQAQNQIWQHQQTDFREISIIPTIDDLNMTQNPVLKPVRTHGKYFDLHEYLDINFRLLLEDFTREFRLGVQQFKSQVESPKNFVNIYHNLKVDKFFSD